MSASVRFDTEIDAALYGLALAKRYDRFALWLEQCARERFEPVPDQAREARRHGVRCAQKGERILYDLRGLQHFQLYGIDPHIENLQAALDAANTFVTLRTLDQMPSHLTSLQKAQRLIDTAPDLKGGKQRGVS
jgi:hypothetical protein